MAGHTLRPAACCRMSAVSKGRCTRPVLLLTGTPQPCVHSVTWLKTKQDVTYGAKTRILKNMRASLSILAPLSVALFCALGAEVARAQGGETDRTRAASLRQEAIAYEHGEGVTRDPLRAAALYCDSARLGDMQAQYNLGWMYAHGRGVPRDDAAAAFFFHAAAGQGLGVAARMLQVVGGATAEVPACLRPPPPAQAVAGPPGVNYQLTAPRKIVELVLKMAPQYQVEPQLALGIKGQSSGLQDLAVCHGGAQFSGGQARSRTVVAFGTVSLHHLSFLFLCFLGRAWNGSGLSVKTYASAWADICILCGFALYYICMRSKPARRALRTHRLLFWAGRREKQSYGHCCRRYHPHPQKAPLRSVQLRGTARRHGF